MKKTVLKLAAKAAYATAKKAGSFYLWNVSAERAKDTEKEQITEKN